MNPYDFARIDWNRLPERRKPVWHHRFVGPGNQKLFSGSLDVDIYVETPIFIADPRNVSPDPRRPAQSMQNTQGEYIIPGSSLKGMLRCVVETLGNGCLTLFDGEYKGEENKGSRTGRWGESRYDRIDYRQKVPASFQHCGTNEQLCISCRIFGMLKHRASGVFLGKVNIGDARSYAEEVYKYDPMYTAVLVEPKPRHQDFYLDETKKYIAGRKYYFHHSPDLQPRTANGPIIFSGKPANRYIQPLDRNTHFHFRIDFTNLEADEFGALMLAVVLEEQMHHKIGYGKPLGLGSVYLYPTRLVLIDYTARYLPSGKGRGKTVWQGDDVWTVLEEQIDAFSSRHLQTLAMEDLRRIWRWPPDPDVDYYYPGKRDWFDTPESKGKRIADTKYTP